MSFAEEYGSR